MTAMLAPVAAIDRNVTEETCRINVDGSDIVTVLARPSGVASEVGVICVHGWSGNRSGPHGILTALSRRAAAAGFPALRFDFRGRGESEGEGLQASLLTMADDLVAAADLMVQTHGVKHIVYCGMCSGGNVVVGSLKRLPAVRGLFLMSVYPFSDGDAFGRDVHRTWHYLHVYVRKAMQGHTWSRLLRGDVSVKGVLNVLFGHFLKRGGNRRKEGEDESRGDRAGASCGTTAKPTAIESRTQGGDAPRKHLANLRADLPGIMVYGSVDPDASPALDYYRGYAEEKHLPMEFREIEGANHNFSSHEWTLQLGQWLTELCRKEAGREPPNSRRG